MAAKSDYGKAVADVHRDLRKHVENIPVINQDEKTVDGKIDGSVKEKVISDIDRMIEHNENLKPWP